MHSSSRVPGLASSPTATPLNRTRRSPRSPTASVTTPTPSAARFAPASGWTRRPPTDHEPKWRPPSLYLRGSTPRARSADQRTAGEPDAARTSTAEARGAPTRRDRRQPESHPGVADRNCFAPSMKHLQNAEGPLPFSEPGVEKPQSASRGRQHPLTATRGCPGGCEESSVERRAHMDGACACHGSGDRVARPVEPVCLESAAPRRAMVKQVVDAHTGGVQITSRAGRSTRVRIVMPWLAADAHAPAPASVAASPAP